MESTARDRLRRDVRRVVHQTCLRHFERDPSSTPARADYDLTALRAACAEAGINDGEVDRWIAEDEAEFDRAVLVSDLVARRVGTRAPAAKPAAAVSVEPLPPAAPASRPARSEPSIAALLDDMFAQRKPTPSR